MLLVLLVSRVLPLQQQRVALRHYPRCFRIRDAIGVKAHAGRRGARDVGIEGEAMEEEVDSEGAKDGERVSPRRVSRGESAWCSSASRTCFSPSQPY
ncbi:hypothetical protein K438DRAFT_124063 [Mycena galopus ATCC 62051]|nr:hypothetical protein K438DRAFT_124063 [Mycena galopus ATCC 62051]